MLRKVPCKHCLLRPPRCLHRRRSCAQRQRLVHSASKRGHCTLLVGTTPALPLSLPLPLALPPTIAATAALTAAASGPRESNGMRLQRKTYKRLQWQTREPACIATATARPRPRFGLHAHAIGARDGQEQLAARGHNGPVQLGRARAQTRPSLALAALLPLSLPEGQRQRWVL